VTSITNTVGTAVQAGRHTAWRIDWDASTSRRGPAPARTPHNVIEPGIYIREAALDNLQNAPENAAFIDKVRPAVQK
jgi:hypothetical protein